MKKLVSILIGLVMIGITATSVSAANYEVQKGDTLWEIANENNTNVDTLVEINELKSSLIHPKQVLILNEGEKKEESYIVQEGDTLMHISNAYGADVTVEKLKKWNDLSSDLITTGQHLIVNDVKAEPEVTKAVEQSAEQSEVEAGTDTNDVIAEEQVEPAEKVEETTTEKVKGETFAVEATAYTAGCVGCSGITATGINLNNDPYAKVIAVDPNVIPLDTRVYVEGYGYAVAGDTGGAIKGNKIDIHLPTKGEAYNWGRKTVNITILE